MLTKLIRTGLAYARRAPHILLWSASAFTWAYTARCTHAYKCGYRHGLNVADWFLERHDRPLQRKFRDFAKRDL
jgi:hypothetical protein